MKKLQDNDYELDEGVKGVWIGIKNVSIRVTECDEGVNVDLFANGREDEGPIASTWITFDQASEV